MSVLLSSRRSNEINANRSPSNSEENEEWDCEHNKMQIAANIHLLRSETVNRNVSIAFIVFGFGFSRIVPLSSENKRIEGEGDVKEYEKRVNYDCFFFVDKYLSRSAQGFNSKLMNRNRFLLCVRVDLSHIVFAVCSVFLYFFECVWTKQQEKKFTFELTRYIHIVEKNLNTFHMYVIYRPSK